MNYVLKGWYLATAAVCGFGLMLAGAQIRNTTGQQSETLDAEFQTPPMSERPWVYYWWVEGNVDRQTITRDLEQMKEKGIGGFLLLDARGYGDNHLPPPPPPTEFLSPEWLSLVKFTMAEANRLGLKMSMNLSTHGGSLRAPWKTGVNAPKKLVWTSADVKGPAKFDVSLRKPGSDFWDIALLAVRLDRSAGSGPDANSFSKDWRDIVFDRKALKPRAKEVVDLTDKINAGRLTWDVPEGDWTILRFGGVLMEGHDTDVDILNASAVDDHFQRMGRAFLDAAGPLAGKTLTFFYNVSWEGASPTWTPGFDRDFLKYRGYDDRPYLPVLAGITVKDEGTSSRFLEDYSRTIGDCFMNNCYRRLGELCHKAGLKWHSESGGPWDREKPLFRDSDQLTFWGANDMPQGEFWHDRWEKRPDGTRVWLSNMRRVSMAAHIYGRPLAAAESFTNMNPHWQEYPAVLKPDIDAAFIDGTNQVVWHTFDASPASFGKPGIVYFAGTHLNPNVTWWDDAGAFLTYLGRAQVMLRRGKFVADACVYVSDRNYLRWGRDKAWGGAESLQLPRGYAYDLIDTEVLLNRISLRDGNLVLPDGMTYRMLVLDLDENEMPAAALAKIVELAKSGATVVLGRRQPEREPGLDLADTRDTQIRTLAHQLWSDNESQGTNRFGKGQVIRGVNMDTALRAQNILPDFEGPFEYLHRRTSDADIYFLKGSGQSDCTFRVTGKEPEFWDAVSGSIRDAETWRVTNDGRTAVSIDLPENGSIFVVFRHHASGPRSTTNEKEHAAGTLALNGPWEITFPQGWGAPASATFEHLTPWNENSQNGIRYFSGTATYHKTFDLDAEKLNGPLRLELGEVKDIVCVRLNGKSLGIVWTAPWSLNITGAAKTGANDLEIEVTNTWVNRLIGDAALPEQDRITKTIVRRSPAYTGRYPYLRGYLATDPLLRSGLMGPVRVQFHQKER